MTVTREQAIAELKRRQELPKELSTVTREQAIAELKKRERPKESAAKYAIRKVGRGLRHAETAVNSLRDLPRNLLDMGSTLIRNKPLFDPSEPTFVQQGYMENAANGALKPRTKGEEWGDAIIPNLMTVTAPGGALKYAPKISSKIASFVGKTKIPAYTATAVGSAGNKIINDSENDPESIFHNLSPREKLLLQLGVGLVPFGVTKKLGQYVAKKADQTALAHLSDTNKALMEAGEAPIKPGLFDYFPGSGSLAGGATSGRIKEKHSRLGNIIKGSEEAVPLEAFFDEHGFREGPQAFISKKPVRAKEPHIMAEAETIIEPESVTKIVVEKPQKQVPTAEYVEVPKKPNQRSIEEYLKDYKDPYHKPNYLGPTKRHHLDELMYYLDEHNKPGFGPTNMEAMAEMERFFPTKPHAKFLEEQSLPQGTQIIMEKSKPKKQASIIADQEPTIIHTEHVEAPKKQHHKEIIPQTIEDVEWVKDPSNSSISLKDIDDNIMNPEGTKIIRDFGISLPDTIARSDAAKSILNRLSPTGDWLEIVSKYDKLPIGTQKEIIKMLAPHERAKFAGAVNYASRILPKLKKEAGKPLASSPSSPYRDALESVITAATTGIPLPARMLGSKLKSPVKKAISSGLHSSNLAEFIQHSHKKPKITVHNTPTGAPPPWIANG